MYGRKPIVIYLSVNPMLFCDIMKPLGGGFFVTVPFSFIAPKGLRMPQRFIDGGLRRLPPIYKFDYAIRL
jgi:hypothetical protein